MATPSSTSPVDLETTSELAFKSIQQGEFENAENLFVKILDMLSQAPETPPFKILQIRLEIASVRLSGRKYKESEEDIKAIQKDIDEIEPINDADKALKAELDLDCHLRLANHMLATTQWKEASDEYRRLLQLKPSSTLHRDIALAYAQMGQCDLAKEHIATAWSELHSSVDNSSARDSEAPNSSTECQCRQAGQGLEHYRMKSIEATINMLSGDYQAALEAFSEALDFMRETLGPNHYLAIDAKCQLGSAHLANGDYRTSVTILEDAISQTKSINAGYYYELTRAYLSYGKVDKACYLAAMIAMALGGLTQTRPYHRDIMQDLRRRGGLRHDQSPLGFYMNYDLISTMRLLANIEVHMHNTWYPLPDLSVGQETLEFLRKDLAASGHGMSIASATVRYDLGRLLLASPRNLLWALPKIEEVARDRATLLGDSHLDTLCARRELAKARFLLDIHNMERGEAKQFDWDELKSTSENIRSSIESKCGPQHPESLTSRLWCLTQAVLTQEKIGTKPGDTLMSEIQSANQLLSDPKLVSERLVESISMKISLCGLVAGSENSYLAEEYLDAVEKQIKEAREETSDTWICGELEKRAAVIDEFRSAISATSQLNRVERSGVLVQARISAHHLQIETRRM
ncbi:hypothetical protein F4677DRAFT_460563 [Hypoxylon crocopeplum]|nr:hypothetical protein F4677DRAFT_460563 [Hypoxylon crocopeplum]